MLLASKNAIIYGAGGSLGSAIAHALAKEGAKVFVTGHHLKPVQLLAHEINNGGGKAEAAEVDALNEKSVNDFVNNVVKAAGTVDISLSLIDTKDIQGIPLVELPLEDFTRPVRRVMESQFITGTAAGRVMIKQQSGVILSLTATPGGIGYPNAGGFGPACHLIESFSLGLASELGKYGVRVVNIRSAGSPDSQVFKDAITHGGDKAKDFIKKIEDDTMLKRMPLMKDIANTAVFLASDMAAGITGVTVDVTCGTTTALNYKAPPIAFVIKKD
jgi:NAD(P)-dependent dehydrogenase (short-subunit alcohol dehydrogenase family)